MKFTFHSTLLTAAFLLISVSISIAQVVINVKDYGAKGDGRTDDYPALVRVAQIINKRGGGEVFFPPGDYYIGVYHHQNKIADIEFSNGSGLKIHGKNAKISVKGNFHRAVTKKDRYIRSTTTAVIPLKITNYRNVVIENLEIDGNVDQMTRDNGVMELGGHLLMIANSTNVRLNNLYLHHAQTDGLYIRGNTRNLTAANIVSSNNARQGMSIISLQDATFTDCKFTNTGLTDGKYGHHAPAAGVDIEPHNVPGKMNVSNVTFERCEFSNNIGSQFVCTSPDFTTDIKLVNARIIASERSTRYTVILAGKNMLVDKSYIDCKEGTVFAIWPRHPNSTVTIRNSEIRSRQRGIIATNDGSSNEVLIQNNKLIYTGSHNALGYFPYLQNKNLRFIGNEIVIPSKAIKNANRKAHALVQHAIESRGNRFITELNSVTPKVNYSKTKIVNDNNGR